MNTMHQTTATQLLFSHSVCIKRPPGESEMSRTTRTNAINRKTLIPCQHVNSVNESKGEWLLPVLEAGKAKFETNSTTGWKGKIDSHRELHLQMMLNVVSEREREREFESMEMKQQAGVDGKQFSARKVLTAVVAGLVNLICKNLTEPTGPIRPNSGRL